MNPVLSRLPVLILHPHGRCNCRCVMCDIWKVTESPELSPEDLECHAESVAGLGVEWVVFSGGEPLMHSDLFRLCAILRSRRIRVTVLSTGILVARHAARITAHVDDLIVSLDGPEEVHNAIRRVPGAFRMLSEGISALRLLNPALPIHARCTVQSANCSHLAATVETAKRLGLNGISFLAADLTSEAFNRPEPWPLAKTQTIAVSGQGLADLEEQLQLISGDPYVAEGPAKLSRIAAHFRAHLEQTEAEAPTCNAPWVSAVVEADGSVRPCFFHRPIGQVNASVSLGQVLNSPQAVAFRTQLDVASNPVCRRCVCSLNWQG